MARGGAGKNDFFLRFGSDADVFSQDLITDLNKSRGVVKLLITDLKNLDKAANTSRGKLTGLLAADVSRRGGDEGGGGGGGGSHGGDPTGFYRDLNSIGDTLRSFNTELATVVRAITFSLGEVPKAGKEYQTKLRQSIAGQIAAANRHVDENNIFRKANDPRVVGTVGQVRNQVLPNLSAAAQTQARQAPGTTGVRVGNTGLISSGFDRVVHKLDEIKNLLSHGIPTTPQAGGGGAPRVGLTTPAVSQAAAQVKATAGAAVTPQQVEAATASEAERLKVLDADMAKIALDMERLTKAMTTASAGVREQMQGVLATTKKAMEGMKADRAALEREVTGKTRTQQKEERRTAAADQRKALPEQDEEYYDDILRRRQVLDRTANAGEFLASATGRGKGKVSRDDLFGMVEDFKGLGYAPQGINKSSKKEDIAQALIGSRAQMEATLGPGQYPPELELGRKMVATKISDYMHKLLGGLNAAAAKSIAEAQAGETMSAFNRSGGQGFTIDENGQVRTKGNAGLRVSPGLPSQAFGPNAPHVDSAQAILDARRKNLSDVGIAEAKRNAQSRDFNPHDPALYQEITKGNADPQIAKQAMHALAQLKESTRALDMLGDEFRVFDEQVHQTGEFIKRAEWRARKLKDDPDRVSKHPLTDEQYRLATTTDPANVVEAKASMQRMRANLNDPKFNGLDQLFRSNPYQQGRDARYEQEQANEARREAAAAARHYSNANIQEASGAAVFGTRLAPGTGQTYVRNIPGGRWNQNLNRVEFTDDNTRLNAKGVPTKKPQSELDELNRYQAAYTSSLTKEALIKQHDPDNLSGLEKAKAKTENKATAFLNQVSEIFGYSPTMESLIGRKPVDPSNIASEDLRNEQRRAVDERAARKFTPKDDATILADREATLARMLQALTAAKAQQKQADANLKSATTKLAKSLGEEDEATKAARAQQVKLAEEAGRRNRKAAQAEANLEAAGGSGRFIPGTKTTESTWRQGPLMESGTFSSEEEIARKAKAAALKAQDALSHATVDATPQEQAVFRAAQAAARAKEGVTYLAGDGKNDKGAIDRQRDRLPQSAQRLATKLEEAVKEWETHKAAVRKMTTAATSDTLALVAERQALLEHREALFAQMRAVKTGRPSAQGLTPPGAHIQEGQVYGPLNRFGEFESGGPRAGIHESLQEVQARLTELNGVGPVKRIAAAQDVAGSSEGRVKNIQSQLDKAAKTEEVVAKTKVQANTKEANDLRKQLEDINALTKQRTELRAQLKAANKAGQVATANTLREQVEAINAQLPDKKTRTAMRSQLNALDNAARGGGGGGAGGGKGGAADEVGGGKDNNSLLRQILNELKAFHTSAKGGLPVKGKIAEEGGSAAKVGPRRVASPEELLAAKGQNSTEEDRALAATAQQRRLRGATNATDFAAANPSQYESAWNQAYARQNSLLDQTVQKKRKSSEQTRAQVRAEQQLATTLAGLDSNSRRELENLRALIKAGADDVAITTQQAKAYAALDARLEAQGVAGASVRKGQIRGALSDAQGTKVSGTEIDDVARQAKSVNGFETVDKAMAQQVPGGGIFGEQSAFTRAMFGNHGFWSRVMASTGTFVVRNFTAGFVFGLTNALQQVIKQAILTESTFIRVSDALDQTGRSTGNLRTQLQGISSKYGTNLEDVYQTAAGLVGLFDNIDDIAGATKVVSELQMISGGALNAQEAMGALASITGAYGDQLEGGVDGLSQVADVLTVVQNVIGTNIETTAEGVASLSGLSKQLKIDFQDTAVYVAQIAKLTNQTGAASGEQFGRILAAMQTGRGRTALTRALPGTGIDAALGKGNYGQALQILLKNWNGLTDAQQRNIATSIAGQRQARAFAALTANTAKTLNAQAQAHDASGQAQKRAEAIARQLNVQIQKLGSNFQNFAQNLIRTGVLDFLGIVLKTTNQVLSVTNKLLSTFNDLADASPFTKFLKNMVAGLLGLIVTLKIGRMAFAGFRASVNSMRAGEGAIGAGLNAAAASGTAGAVGGPGLIAGSRVGQRFEETTRASRLNRLMQPYMREPLPAAPISSRIADNAARGVGKVNSGLSTLASMGPVAQAGLIAVFAVISAGIDSLHKSAQLGKDLDELYSSKYDKSGREKVKASSNQQETTAAYIGPFTQKYRDDVVKQNKGFMATASFGVGQTLKSLNPFAWKENQRTGNTFGTGMISGYADALSDKLGLGYNKTGGYAAWKGDLPTKTTSQLSFLKQRQQDLLSQTNQGGQNELLKTMSGGLAPTLAVPADVADKAAKGAKELAKQIAATRASVNKDKSLSSEQRAHALAELEEMQKNLADKIANIQLLAEGVSSIDQLTVEQLTRVGQMSDLFGTLASSGSGIDANNPQYKKLFSTFMEDTGVRPESDIGKDLTKLMNGRLTKSQVLLTQMSDEDKTIKQLTARYEAAQGQGLPQEDIDAIFSQLTSVIQNRASQVQQFITQYFDDSSAMADAAAATGNFGQAASLLRGAGATSAFHRNRRTEDPATRATRDSAERSAYERSAQVEAQGQNVGLETSKARGMSAAKAAKADEQIARNQYTALREAQAAARAVGAQGPSADAIHQAKVNWLAAQHSSATAAQEANITRMTAAAAGIWNSVAAGAASEAIAMQQYKNAVANAGKGSAEAAQAWGQVVSQRKANMQNQDQINEAQRQANIAAIPQGNAVRIARANVSSARAALAAAQKYGHNSTEYQGALSQLYSAQQQAVQAQQAVQSAQAQLAQAYADARGDTVGSARAAERGARLQLAQARKNSGGAKSADVLAAKAAVVQARAATRDAMLQDRLDTIDFNLQMGKTTQSSAIAAMQQILRTANLTKQQRRDLLLKIKGMKDEIADGPWNFENVSLPTPYQMRRYVKAEAMNAAQAKMTPYRDSTSLSLQDRPSRGGEPGSINDNRTVLINGADTAKVRAILTEILGKSVKTRTAQGRRR